MLFELHTADWYRRVVMTRRFEKNGAHLPDETANGALLDLKLVGDIAGSFRVPRYQRGYRWGKLEVERLLNDIWENGDKDYSLQPVVVKRDAKDEVADLQEMPKEVITTMKTYCESGTFQRGQEAVSGDASIAMFGNTNQPVDVMVQTGHLFAPMPDIIRDDMAFIDRMHFYLPGWEIPKMRNEMFTDHYGFVVDYLAEALREMRKHNFTEVIDRHWQRKHVDWEIGSSLRHTEFNPRSGLLGILLPAYLRPAPGKYSPHTIPPRLHDNIKCGFGGPGNGPSLDSRRLPAEESSEPRQLS